jgi:hypothetical protein
VCFCHHGYEPLGPKARNLTGGATASLFAFVPVHDIHTALDRKDGEENGRGLP